MQRCKDILPGQLSFWQMWCKCNLAVPSLMANWLAILLFGKPSVTMRATVISRGVNKWAEKTDEP
jgi:hypothetical protein